MALWVRLPKDRERLLREDLSIAIGAAATPDSGRLQVKLASSRFVGLHHDSQGRASTFVSGGVTRAVAPCNPGLGARAAEAVSNAYAQGALQGIEGNFIAAIFDWERNSAVLVRDKIGIARAYVHETDQALIFSDSLADIVDDNRALSLDLDSVHAFLTLGWIPSPHSMFREIAKLEAGALLKWKDGTAQHAKYYDVPHAGLLLRSRPSRELSEDIRVLLNESVDAGAALGEKWGSFLSGGVNSSSVVASLARNGAPLQTYFGGFEPALNKYLPNPEEPEMSKLVASACGTDHHMMWLGPEVLDDAAGVIEALEEPVCDGGCLLVNAIMQQAQTEVDAMMTGVGGDFLFSGERRHVVPNLLRYMRLAPRPLWQALRALIANSPLSKSARLSQLNFDLTRLLNVSALSPQDMYAGFFLQADHEDIKTLFVGEALSKLTRDTLAENAALFAEVRDRDLLAQFLYLDLKTQCTEHCVRETETLGRRYGLSIYNPFLDSRLVDYAMTIPSTDKVIGLAMKMPLKNAMRGVVPNSVLDRKKGALGSPIRWWVTRDDNVVSRTLSKANIERRGIFSQAAIARFRDETASGVKDYSKLLWSLFTLELWMQRFIDGRSHSNQ